MTLSTSPAPIEPAPSGSRPIPRRHYLVGLLVPIGFVVPNAMLGLHIADAGLAPADYFGAWVDSLPSAQLLADLVVCSVAFIAWAAVDGRRLGVRWWVTVPATLLVGLCFAIPLYLLMRERALGFSRDVAGAHV